VNVQGLSDLKPMVLCIPSFKVLNSRGEDERVQTELVVSISEN
jgi:hypothetical protein